MTVIMMILLTSSMYAYMCSPMNMFMNHQIGYLPSLSELGSELSAFDGGKYALYI